MVLFSTAIFAKEHVNYVKTSDGTFFFKKVKHGISCCLVGVKDNGDKVKFEKSEILAFAKDGQLYEKKPVYKGNKQTGEMEFMAVKCIRNGLTLYEYEYISKKTDQAARRYYVFKGDEYMCEMDNTNKPTLCDFFTKK
jgi:hypothetical protein